MAGYGSDGGFTTWLAANGYTLPADPPSHAVLREAGSSYIDTKYGDPLASRTFKGQPAGGFAQERAFPRSGVTVYAQAVPTDVIPVVVEKASYYAAYIVATDPTALHSSVGQSGAVRRERIGDLETEYFGPQDGMTVMVDSQSPSFSYIEGLLSPFLQGSSSNMTLMVRSLGPRTDA
jgi:hypothetical protein